MQRLSALDATFLEVEDAVSHMHIGSIAIFEGPPPGEAQLHAYVAGKLGLVPRYRQVVRYVPYRAARPLWVEDPHFNLSYHLRRTALARPGGERELTRLVGRIMSRALDRCKPLWEMWAVEGLDVGALLRERPDLDGIEQPWALISKLHHCMADGVSGSDLLTVLLDEDPDAPAPTADDWHAPPLPGEARLLAAALAADVLSPVQALRALRAPRALATRMSEAARGLLRFGEAALPPPPSSLNGPLGASRRWARARAELSDLRAVKDCFGGSINDIVLACIAGGFRELLTARGESLVRVVRTLVPVSVRTPAQHGTYDNRVSAIFADLPVWIADPLARLESIKAQMAELKASGEAVAGELITSALDGFAPPMLLALAERFVTRLPQHSVNTVTTNVPGPQTPLYAAGRRMVEAFGYVPLAGHIRVGVAIFSYDGRLGFGVTGDYDSAPDIDILCRGIESSLAQLLQARAERVGHRAHDAAVGSL